MFVVSIITILISNIRDVTFSKEAISIALAAGVLASIAVLLQLVAFAKWSDKFALIVIVGSLYPAVVMAFSVFSGHKFSATQWLGFICAIVAIILISMPQKISQ